MARYDNAVIVNELYLFLEPPTFTRKPPSQVVSLPGSSLRLCCEAIGSPRPRIEWSRAQQSSDLPPVFQENGCLVVNTAQENIDGDYICSATNRFGSAEATATVITVPLIGWISSISVSFNGVQFYPTVQNRNLQNNI